MTRVLLGVTGSVAAIRTPALFLRSVRLATRSASWRQAVPLLFRSRRARPVRAGAGRGHDRRAALSRQRRMARNAVSPRRRGLAHRVPQVGGHLDRRAPRCQHLAKFALGISDNFLSCVFRAWDFAKPVILAPAMNTLMWDSPVTLRHLRQLLEDRGRAGARRAGRWTMRRRFSRGMPPGSSWFRRKPSAWRAATSASGPWPRSPRLPRWSGSGLNKEQSSATIA